MNRIEINDSIRVKRGLGRLSLFRNLYTIFKLIPIIFFIGIFLFGFAVGLSASLNSSLLDSSSLVGTGSAGLIIGLTTVTTIISFIFPSICYSFWIDRVSKVALSKKSYVGLSYLLFLFGYILYFAFSAIPIFSIPIFAAYIYSCFKAVGVLKKIDDKFQMKAGLNIFGTCFGIFFVWFISFLSAATDADILFWIAALMYILHGTIVVLTMNKIQRIIKEKPDLITAESANVVNKDITNFLTSRDWQYAKNGKLYFIKFNQGSIAEVTSKEEKETKFYNWRINDGYLFCDHPDFKGGGQFVNDLVQFKTLTLSPVLPSKTVSSTDNK